MVECAPKLYVNVFLTVTNEEGGGGGKHSTTSRVRHIFMKMPSVHATYSQENFKGLQCFFHIVYF
uniref:Uncharacterized protein n=1 Tax=Anguilla anguilla TaxID=7936 RepID=A0A0E9XP70_ANGAN